MAPPAPTLDEDLALVHRLVDLASEVALEFFHNGVETIIKEDNSPVSEADLEVDRRMLGVLVAERPDDAVLSEESGEHAGGNRRWILDPIDGTFNFVEGRPAWGTHVALEVDGELVLGVISRPVYELRYWATRGGGAYKRGTGAGDTGSPTQLRVSTTTDLAQSRVTVWSGGSKARVAAIRGACVLVEPGSLDDILAVAEGELDAVIDSRGKTWDHAPAIIIVTEAGGAFRDREGGQRPDLGTSRYTNGRIDGDLNRLLDD